MAESIVNISQMTDALRNTGYKNLESAVAEIVDNSIEANASEIFIVLTESTIGPKKRIKDIAILDNGDGMDSIILNKSLGLGSTTRAARKSMGRFGVGLPQASLYATPHVEVYSWQNGLNSSQMVYLDVEEIKSGKQTEIADPIQVKIPDVYRKLAALDTEVKKFNFTQSGTLVIWKDCDRLNPKTKGGIISRLKKEIGKKFRHYIHKKKCEMWIITIAEKTNEIEDQIKIKPNDPLLLMDDNWILGDENNPGEIASSDSQNSEPIFEPYPVKMEDGTWNPSGKIIKNIKYLDSNKDIKTGKVTLQFSIVKDKFYDKNSIMGTPGSTPIGKAIKSNVGISVVRHDREIDFGKFDYFKTTNSPTHRWWGCEISFEPDLDEVFGVSNNKQQVDLKKTDDEYEDMDLEVEPLWNQLDVIERTIKEMVNKNKKKRANTRSQEPSDLINSTPTPAESILNTIERDVNTRTDEEVRAILQESGYKDEITQELIEFWRPQQVWFHYENLGEMNPPFSFDQKQDLAIIEINVDNPFYTQLVEPLENLEESARTMFELLLGSYSKALLELDSYSHKENLRVTKKWRSILEECIEKIGL